MLVLRTLIREPLHGYGIAKSIQAASGDQLSIEFGSLYPALKRLELKGWVSSEWDMSELNRRAKYDRLTKEGRGQLNAEHARWTDFVRAVTAVMEPL